MKSRLLFLPAVCAFTMAASAADSVITRGYSREDAGFSLDPVPPPAIDDAAAGAEFKIVTGSADPNSRGGLAALHDGKVPGNQDDPEGNFFFAPGTESARLLIDLGKVIDVKSVATYSWHHAGRGAQDYTLYVSDGASPDFQAEPAAGTDPEKVGWKAAGKAQSERKRGGQHAIEISGGPDATLGKQRYLLLDTKPNEDPSGFGWTFWSEIDVIDAAAPPVKRLVVERILDTFTTDDGKYKFIVDSTKSPDLREWFGQKVMPQVKEWYPKIVDLLAVPGYPSPTEFNLRLEEGVIMPGHEGVPAYASGRNIVVSSRFMRSEEKGEAVGCVIHEITHIAQNSDWGRRRRVPSWVVEGVADYVRWFLFEPESNGAEIRNPARAKHDASYRVTANFFNWVTKNHDKDLTRKLNATFSTGYNDGLWKEWTGKTVEELEADWKKSLEAVK